MSGVPTMGPQDPAAKEVNTDSDTKFTGVTASDRPVSASEDGTNSSPQATAKPAGSAETVSEALPPRKRRGILLGTGAGVGVSAGADDAKSLSWMATQAVKAANAVKASQLEQAQAWKSGAGMPEEAQSPLAEDDFAAFNAGEPVAMERQAPVQPSQGEPPATTEAVQPDERSREAATTTRIPAGALGVAALRVPARMVLILGVLVMFSYAGYRHWFAGDHAASDAPAATSAIIEPAGPGQEANLMTPPPISAVAAPEPAAGHAGPAVVETGMAHSPGAEEANLMRPPPVSVVAAPEPAAGQSTPPDVGAGMAPMPEPATETQPATAAAAPQPAPAYPASDTKPEAWYPSAVPEEAPSTAVDAGMNARQSVPPPSAPPVEADVAASEAAPPSPPPPAVEAKVPARQPVTPAPATRPGYPAKGYGYYQPPSSWQPYYQPGYPQSPARR